MAFIKVILVTMLAAVGACGFGAVALATYVWTGGIAAVEVEAPDLNLHLPVPLRLLDLGLGVASIAVPTGNLTEVRGDLEEWRPLLDGMADEIHSLPEGELVRVKTSTELVLVTHRDGRIGVEITTPDTHVRITAPRRAIGRIVDRAVGLATDG